MEGYGRSLPRNKRSSAPSSTARFVQICANITKYIWHLTSSTTHWTFVNMNTFQKNSFNVFENVDGVLQCWTILTINGEDQDNDSNKDNAKDNPGDLWHLRHWLQSWQLKTWHHDNHESWFMTIMTNYYLTIKSDLDIRTSGQHSQFLQCLIKEGFLKNETKFSIQSSINSKLIQQVLKKADPPIPCFSHIYTLNQPTCCTYNFWPHFAKLSLIFLNSSKINSSPWLINYNMIVFKIFFMAYYNRWASHWHDWELLGFGRWAFGCWSSGLWGFWDIEILDLGHWCVGLLRHMDMNIVYYNVLNLTFAH